eukprot:TRINITY_DN8336_c0_g2_i1.p1 TRINITY_DN8336_c0_g2~~TRINITY_DN8336_c0_g2_i1.p1  ORF type:complete len:678 (-),score=153.09 TRINITY_DN8336_c0_g2_i1:48-2057(-)
MASSATATERLVAGLTLHRSETVAHTAALLDRKNVSIASRARGRCEGFASKLSNAFKPLGAPLPPDRVMEVNSSKLVKVKKIQEKINSDASSAHQDKKDKEKERTRRQDAERPKSPEAKDGNDQAAAEEKGLEAERREPQSLASLPHGLHGKDLPRLPLSKRQEFDGFTMLRAHIKESDRRLDLVKTDVFAPPGEKKRPKEASKPDGMQLLTSVPRPQSGGSVGSGEDGGGAFLTSIDVGQPLSARGSPRQARPLPPAPLSARQPQKAASKRLPSLADYLASPGGGSGAAASPGMDRSERGGQARVREMINMIGSELLGLPKGSVRHGQGHDEAGGRKGRMHIRRKLEKELDSAWKDRQFWKRCNLVMAPREVEEMRRRCQGDEEKLAALERILKDLSAEGPAGGGEGERAASSSAADAVGAAGGGGQASQDTKKAATGQSNADGLASQGQRSLEDMLKVPQRPDEQAPARFRAIQQKALTQLRDPDPQVSSVARLRGAVYDYQASRDLYKNKLEAHLNQMTQDRMESMEKRLASVSHGRPGASSSKSPGSSPTGQDADPGESEQIRWYRGLLYQVRGKTEGKEVPKAIHILLDSVRQTLEQGQEFDSEALWASLSQLVAGDITAPVAQLLVAMLSGLSNVQGQDLGRQCKRLYGEVPQEVLEALAESS